MADESEVRNPRRRRWPKKRLVLLCGLVVGLAWLDGPGWRWLAQVAATRVLLSLGYAASFELDGRWSLGHLQVSKLRLRGEHQVRSVRLERLEIDFRWSRLLQKQIDRLAIRELDVDIDLAASAGAAAPSEDSTEEAEPVDLTQLLEQVRGTLIPMEIDLQALRLHLRDGSTTLFRMEPSGLRHAAGSDRFDLELGSLQLPGERRTAAQKTRLDWQAGLVTLDQLGLLDQLALTQLQLEPGDSPRLQAEIACGEARVQLETDLSQASLNLTRGTLSTAEIARITGWEPPLEASLSALRVDLQRLEEGVTGMGLELQARLPDLNYDGWRGRDLQLAVGLGRDLVASLRGDILGSPALLDLTAELDRAAGGRPTAISASLRSDSLQPALDTLRERFGLDTDTPAAPPSRLVLRAGADFSENGPPYVAGRLELQGTAESPAVPLTLAAGWQGQELAVSTLEAPGFALAGDFHFGDLRYSGRLGLERFSPTSLAPWLEPFRIGLPGGVLASLDWHGNGNFRQRTHAGALDLVEGRWDRGGDIPPIAATLVADYQWPQRVDLPSLRATQGEQTLEVTASLEERLLKLDQLSWARAEQSLAQASGSIPLAEELGDWKAMLRETRPIALEVQTPELALSELHDFLPEDVRFRPNSRGSVQLALAGTPADPRLTLELRGRAIGLSSQPQVPPADLELTATGQDQDLKVEGALSTADFPPAKIQAVTRWTPEMWAEDPATVRRAPLDAGLRIDDLNLALLQTFLPGLRRLGGRLQAELTATGTLGEPVPAARLSVDDAQLRLEDPRIPRIADGRVRLTADEQGVRLDSLRASVAAGSIDARGELGLDGWLPSRVDLRLDARDFPAIRDDSMIVRLDAGLTLRGPWESARLSGRIGVVDSLFFKDIELLPIGEPMTSVAEPKLPSIDAPRRSSEDSDLPAPFRDWALDVALKTDMPFLIRGNLARGSAELDARVRGTVGKPRPSGKATLREITAKLPFSTLEVRRGEIELRPDHPFDPVLDIRGRSQIRPYDVTVYVYGPISDPKIQPTANPPLPETEVMTLIATGTTTEGLEDPTAATARATQLLIEEARRGRIGAVRVLRPVFSLLDGLDFQVGESDPFTSRKFNSVSFDINDSWEVSAGISGQGNTRSEVTYLFRFR